MYIDFFVADDVIPLDWEVEIGSCIMQHGGRAANIIGVLFAMRCGNRRSSNGAVAGEAV